MLETKLYNLLFNKIREQYRALFKIFFIIFFFAIATSFLLEKRYTSIISIIPNTAENNTSSLGLLVQDFGISGGGVANFPIAEIASSNSILDIIYQKSFDLSEDIGTKNLADLLGTNRVNFLNRALLSITNKDSNNPNLLKYNTIKKFKEERLVINYDRKTNITSISVTIEDPLAAKQITRAFYDELTIFINKTINDAGKIKQNFLNQRIDSVESELLINEKNLQDFLNENKSIKESPKLSQELNRLEREVSIKETSYLLLKKELEVAKIDEVKHTLKLIIIEKPDIPSVKSYPSRLSFSLSLAFLFIILWFFAMIKNDIIRIFKTLDD